MQRLPILLVNRDPDFVMSPEHVIERRGCDLHPAQSGDEVKALLSRYVFALGVVNALSARFPPEAVRVLHAALRRQHPIGLIVVAPPDLAAPLRALALPDCHVLTPPLRHRLLLELSTRLVGIGARRAANAVAQIHTGEEEAKTIRMGFVENVSRHGALLRVDKPIPMGAEIVVSFVLPGSRERNDVRGEVAREITSPGAFRYGVSFTQVMPDVYERLADFVSRG